jgi:ubiquinone/menaquinone biosynthesis C-methylase UbiE
MYICRCVHGVSEALPLADASCDAVVCTLTLCSVIDPAASLAEVVCVCLCVCLCVCVFTTYFFLLYYIILHYVNALATH